jgi:hypothetical protein
MTRILGTYSGRRRGHRRHRGGSTCAASQAPANSPMQPSMRSLCGDMSTAASAAPVRVTPGCPKLTCTITDSAASAHGCPKIAAVRFTSGATALRRSGDHEKGSGSRPPSKPTRPTFRRGWQRRRASTCTAMAASRPKNGAGKSTATASTSANATTNGASRSIYDPVAALSAPFVRRASGSASSWRPETRSFRRPAGGGFRWSGRTDACRSLPNGPPPEFR